MKGRIARGVCDRQIKINPLYHPLHLSISVIKICITWDPYLLIINLHYKRSITCSRVLGTHYPCSRPVFAGRIHKCSVHTTLSWTPPVFTGGQEALYALWYGPHSAKKRYLQTTQSARLAWKCLFTPPHWRSFLEIWPRNWTALSTKFQKWHPSVETRHMTYRSMRSVYPF